MHPLLLPFGFASTSSPHFPPSSSSTSSPGTHIPVSMVRQDVHFTSHGETLAAWLYPAEGGGADGAGPAIVLGHGLGCSKELGMDKYCEEFSRVGYTCLAFDYRNFGGSTGKPRGHINTTKQVEDFHAAIAYIRSLPQVAPERVGIFGSSFGGGNVIQVASQDPRLKATISQCPFTNGLLSTSKVGIAVAPFVAARALRDFMWGSNDDPVTISLIGEPGSVALMNRPDAVDGYKSLIPAGFNHPLNVPARVGLAIPFTFPGWKASKVKTPILFAICKTDSLCPADTTEGYAKKAAKSVIKMYDCGHFDIYKGKDREVAMKDYLSFLDDNLPIKARL